MIKALVDNDILIKGSAYGLLLNFISVIPSPPDQIGLLGASRFIVPKRLQKMGLKKPSEQAITVFETLIQAAQFLEPTQDETNLASQLEMLAQKENLPLDSGESQLLAILIKRSIDNLVTGDKRGISAMETLAGRVTTIDDLRSKVMCLEQLFNRLLKIMPKEEVRDHICAEREVDKSISICFSCLNAGDVTIEEVVAALNSYINAIRSEAPILLCV